MATFHLLYSVTAFSSRFGYKSSDFNWIVLKQKLHEKHKHTMILCLHALLRYMLVYHVLDAVSLIVNTCVIFVLLKIVLSSLFVCFPFIELQA